MDVFFSHEAAEGHARTLNDQGRPHALNAYHGAHATSHVLCRVVHHGIGNGREQREAKLAASLCLRHSRTTQHRRATRTKSTLVQTACGAAAGASGIRASA